MTLSLSAHSGASTSAAAGVQITSRPGAIDVHSPRLFADGDESIVRRMIAGALAVPEVETVDIDRKVETVSIHFQRRGLQAAAALARISSALNEAADSNPSVTLAGIDLSLLHGNITRVERHRRNGGVVTTVFSTGAGWLSACSRMVQRLRGSEAARNERGPVEVVVVQGLVVHFQPPAADSVPEPELGGPRLFDTSQAEAAVIQGHDIVPVQRRIPVARGLRRVGHLAAAGGCFVMSFVGLVTPGIPTVPFVLATSYFLVRSSPTLDERLRRSRLFGQLVRDWQAYGGMRPSTKRHFILFTLALMGLTLLLAGPSIPLLVIGGGMGVLGVTMILRLPAVPEDAPDDLTLFEPA